MLRIELVNIGLSLVLFSMILLYYKYAHLAYFLCFFGLITGETALGLSLFFYYYMTKRDRDVKLLDSLDIFD